MKVRHKQTGEVFKDGWLHPQEHIWKVVTEHDEVRQYMEFACELLPTEQWRDVTSECEASADTNFNGLMHRNLSRYQTTPWADGYRLRKVHLYSAPRYDETSRLLQEAFVVERKESHD